MNVCGVEGCGAKSLCKGMCSMHYYRVKRGGSAEVTRRQQKATKGCSFAGCDKPHASRSLCQTHYMAWRRTSRPDVRKKDAACTARWKASNPEAHSAQQERYGQKHRGERSVYVSQWKRDNWDTYKAYLAARKARVRRATPPWADLAQIEALYRACPAGYHVDHIVPINGRNVSGLHVLDNLRYLPASENLKKSNKF